MKDDASSLSDKIFLEKEWIGNGGGIATKDVKESVKKLKDMRDLNDYKGYSDAEKFMKKIDKIFGKELI